MSKMEVTINETTIPLRASVDGARSKYLLRRSALIYGAVALFALAQIVLERAPGWQAFGLGLLYPGGGFASDGPWGYVGLAGTVIVFLVALFVWFATGNLALPVAVWAGAAIWAALIAGAPVQPDARYIVPALTLLTILAYRRSRAKSARTQLATRDRRNAYLPKALIKIYERAAQAPAPVEGERELTPDQIAATRYLLDRALQPVNEFNGFDVIDQFQTAALRYQITFSQIALAMAQRHYTPRFHGYLSLGQRNLIDKMTEKKVWGYWILESLWGNFSFDFDPASHDNIMLGGFYNTNVSLYTTNTGDDRYLKPGSIDFRLNAGKSFKHDAKTLAKAAMENFNYSDLVLYPCEPHFSYSFCNLMGFTGLPVNDRLFGTRSLGEVYPNFRSAYENDFIALDGETESGRSRLTGLLLPRFTGLSVEASITWISTAYFPDLARRNWAFIREEAISFDADGEVQLAVKATDWLDSGNYKKSEISALAHTFIAAREHGDRDLADALLKRIDRVCNKTIEDGVLRYPKVSNYYHAFVILGLLTEKGDWAALISSDPTVPASVGPVLAECAYPDVLVAKAYSRGTDLSLVLYPGSATTRQTLSIARLAPGQAYRLRGAEAAEVVADSEGRAQFAVQLDGRTEVYLDAA